MSPLVTPFCDGEQKAVSEAVYSLDLTHKRSSLDGPAALELAGE